MYVGNEVIINIKCYDLAACVICTFHTVNFPVAVVYYLFFLMYNGIVLGAVVCWLRGTVVLPVVSFFTSLLNAA